MAFDRETTLRKAEQFLRAGRVDAAITEYTRVLDEQPADLSTANTLGDLCVKVGQEDRAVELYRRIALHQFNEGFFSKAAALFKKIVRLRPADEEAVVHLGDIAARQGLLAEARTHYSSVAAWRAARGDDAGAAEISARIAFAESARLEASAALRNIGNQPPADSVSGQDPLLSDDGIGEDLDTDVLPIAVDGTDDPVVAAILAMGLEPVEPATDAANAADVALAADTAGALDGEDAEGAEAVPPPRDLETVFAGLRAEVESDPVEDESENHLALARTFLEMEQHEQAIDALHTAVKSPRNRFTCASLLAQAYRDVGDLPRAIEWYERAAEAPPPSPFDGYQLMYDLADLLETMGEHARALAVFLEIDTEAADLLDVRARIDRLSGERAGG